MRPSGFCLAGASVSNCGNRLFTIFPNPYPWFELFGWPCRMAAVTRGGYESGDFGGAFDGGSGSSRDPADLCPAWYRFCCFAIRDRRMKPWNDRLISSENVTCCAEPAITAGWSI